MPAGWTKSHNLSLSKRRSQSAIVSVSDDWSALAPHCSLRTVRALDQAKKPAIVINMTQCLEPVI